MKKNMFLMTFISLAGLLATGSAYYFTRNNVLYSAAITFGTIFYHFAMRLAVGYIINTKFHNRMDYTKRWFREKNFEQALYKKLKVKKWKKLIPSFNPQDFRLDKHSAIEIIQVTCQSEIVHEIIMPLSFVPVIFSIWFGSTEVFLITSGISFIFDSIFVIVQRYNRPRLIRLVKK